MTEIIHYYLDYNFENIMYLIDQGTEFNISNNERNTVLHV